MRYADIVLPEDIYLERYDDLQLGAGKKPYIGLRQPVIPSPFDTFEDYLTARLEGTGVSLDELKAKGIVQLEAKQSPYLGPKEIAPSNTLWMHPSVATPLGLKDKDQVMVSNGT
ncbi:MAG: hypothetical protein WCI05_10855 [Myxococcales bacterium]